METPEDFMVNKIFLEYFYDKMTNIFLNSLQNKHHQLFSEFFIRKTIVNFTFNP